MTPKRLGVWIVVVLAAWSLAGPGGSTISERYSGGGGVGLAQAGDPDQYANGPQGTPGGASDSTKFVPPPAPPRTGTPVGERPGTYGTVSSILGFVSLVLRGITATFWH